MSLRSLCESLAKKRDAAAATATDDGEDADEQMNGLICLAAELAFQVSQNNVINICIL